MNWKVFFVTFWMVFLAEFADKTQLVGMGMSAKSGKPWVVWLGSISAYLIVTAVSVFLGATVGKYIKPEIVKYAGASLFAIVSVLMFSGRI